MPQSSDLTLYHDPELRVPQPPHFFSSLNSYMCPPSPFLISQLLVYEDFLREVLPDPLDWFHRYSGLSHKNCFFQGSYLRVFH